MVCLSSRFTVMGEESFLDNYACQCGPLSLNSNLLPPFCISIFLERELLLQKPFLQNSHIAYKGYCYLGFRLKNHPSSLSSNNRHSNSTDCACTYCT